MGFLIFINIVAVIFLGCTTRQLEDELISNRVLIYSKSADLKKLRHKVDELEKELEELRRTQKS